MTDMDVPSQDWSAVAAAWDDHVDYVDQHSTAATDALLDRVSARAGERVLELAAGPGSLGTVWSKLVGPTGSVVLSDIAPGMVEVARRRNAHLANVEVALIDASEIDRPDDAFDVVASRMGLMFTPEPALAFAEIHRVLGPDGRIGVLTWAGMEHNPWMTCVGMAAMMNGLVAGGPPIGPGGIFSLGDPGELEVLAKDAGFVDVAVEAFEVPFVSDSVDAHIERVGSLAGPLAAVLQAATPDQLAAVRRSASELAAPYLTDDGLVIPGRALLVTGRA
jgi:SAM-dependent methyltransferase